MGGVCDASPSFEVSLDTNIRGGGRVVVLIGLKIIQEAERFSLVAFRMRDGGKCAVGYISRSFHWSVNTVV